MCAVAWATGAAHGTERWEYGALADAIRSGHGLSVWTPSGWSPSAFIEPHYPMALAVADGIAGPFGGAVMIALQIAALVLAARLVAGVASRRLGVPYGAAVFVIALWPPLVIASLKLHPQAFRALLLAALVAAADRVFALSRREHWVFGALVGACVWARTVYLVPVIPLAFAAWQRRRLAERVGFRTRPFAVVALAAAIAVAAPWWIRNAIAFGTFVPFTTSGGFNLAMGNHPGASGEVDDEARTGAVALLPPRPGADEVAGDRALGRAAIDWIAAHPAAAAARWAKKLAFLVAVRPGAGERYPRLLLWAYALFALVTTPLIVWGASRAPPDARRLLLVPALALLGAFAMFAVNQRYRFEADVLLAPFALAGAMSLLRAWRRRTRRAIWRRALVAAACVVIAVPAGLLAGRPDLAASALIRDDAPARVDAVFVANGDVDFHRTRHGADVFRRTGARWFVVSGAGAGGDSGALMADAAVTFGVPRSAILVEPLAESTHENAVFSAPLLRSASVRTVAVVTDPLHSRRLAMTATRAWPGMRVLSATVPQGDACYPATWRHDARCRRAVLDEWKKLSAYLALGWI